MRIINPAWKTTSLAGLCLFIIGAVSGLYSSERNCLIAFITQGRMNFWTSIEIFSGIVALVGLFIIGRSIDLGDLRFKRWLDSHASEFLDEVGVTAGQVVLDFGCGSGTYTIPAAKLVGKDGRVYALDVGNRALDRMEDKARKEGLENIVRIDSSDEKEIQLKEGTVDHVLLIDVLQEIRDRESLFDEAQRILKPDGAVFVFPMHIAEEEVVKLAISRGFDLVDKKVKERILVFGKK